MNLYLVESRTGHSILLVLGSPVTLKKCNQAVVALIPQNRSSNHIYVAFVGQFRQDASIAREVGVSQMLTRGIVGLIY